MSKYVLNRIPDRIRHDRVPFLASAMKLPAIVSIRDKQPAIYDQKNLGSCTSQGAARVLETEMLRQGEPHFTPSRLFIYYNSRAAEGDIPQDAGATVGDAIQSVVNFGAPYDQLWPYDVTQFAVKPPDVAYAESKYHKAVQAYSVQQNIHSIKSALIQGLPVVFGFTCYPGLESAEAAATGYIPLPSAGEQSIGGHCVVITGLNDVTKKAEICNSWSDKWGDHGYGTMDYDYIMNPQLAGDFWIISKCC